MIKSYVITIDEIDEVTDAIEMLREKMEQVKLGKNSIGIITLHPDAVSSGVYKAICEELPFPLAGMTCSAQSANSEVNAYMVSIMILTGDDCNFACGETGDITKIEEVKPQVEKCYLSLRDELGAKPKLALVYAPFLTVHFPGEYIDVISEIDPTVPLYGSVASNPKTITEHHREILTLCNGNSSNESVAFVLISGDFTPQFFKSTFPENSVVTRDVGVVTKVERNRIIEVNDTPAAEFFKKAGFIREGFVDSELLSATFILDYGKNQQGDFAANEIISRAPFVVNEEGVLCFGYVRLGASISIAISTLDEVIETARDVITKVKQAQENGASTALMYSCIGRQIGLLDQPLLELETVNKELSGTMNYVLTYSGGEICPTGVTDEKVFNHEHNQTFVACVF